MSRRQLRLVALCLLLLLHLNACANVARTQSVGANSTLSRIDSRDIVSQSGQLWGMSMTAVLTALKLQPADYATPNPPDSAGRSYLWLSYRTWERWDLKVQFLYFTDDRLVLILGNNPESLTQTLQLFSTRYGPPDSTFSSWVSTPTYTWIRPNALLKLEGLGWSVSPRS